MSTHPSHPPHPTTQQQIATLPIDTAKVRLQLLRRAAEKAGGGAAAAAAAPGGGLGMLGMARKIAAEEGFVALYKGFWPAIHRQLVNATLRVGLYGEITAAVKQGSDGPLSLGTKVLVGMLTGAIGITVANPTDLVKVRFQSEGRLAPGQKPRYSGVMNAYSTIVRTEGVRGLWTGLVPAVLRNSIINASELATYDTAKEAALHAGLPDNLGTHILCGAAAGLMATIVGNPIDVVKTRVMAAGAGTGPSYTGPLDCIIKTMRHEGPAAFYQGVVPQFFRITGWNVIMFVALEQFKRAAAGALQ